MINIILFIFFPIIIYIFYYLIYSKNYKNAEVKPILSLDKNLIDEIKIAGNRRKRSNSETIDENLMIDKFDKKYNLSKKLKNKIGVILDQSKLKNVDINDLLSLDLYCFNNSKILFIIGEEKYCSLSKKLKYFNEINYVSPYNYEKKWFSNLIKLPIGKINDKPAFVSINTMISDISNQYGILLNNLILINNSKEKVNYEIESISLFFNL